MAKLVNLLRKDVMILLTTIAFLQTALGFLGFYAALRHKKVWMVVYLLLIWLVGAVLMVEGYFAYKEVNSFQFEANMNTLWTNLGANQQIIQNKAISFYFFYYL